MNVCFSFSSSSSLSSSGSINKTGKLYFLQSAAYLLHVYVPRREKSTNVANEAVLCMWDYLRMDALRESDEEFPRGNFQKWHFNVSSCFFCRVYSCSVWVVNWFVDIFSSPAEIEFRGINVILLWTKLEFDVESSWKNRVYQDFVDWLRRNDL